MPAEWERHRAVWLAWPEGDELWERHLDGARAEWIGLCRAIAGSSNAEHVCVLVRDASARERAGAALDGIGVSFHEIAYGDIWLRDTAPVMCRSAADPHRIVGVRFEFNGWGGKYLYDGDPELAARLAGELALPLVEAGLVLEGGALEVDGAGTVLTTADCVLHADRNAAVPVDRIEQVFARTLGASTTLWLRGRLARDHTDGHIDTLARFAGPGRVLCMRARDASDPNRDVLSSIRRQLGTMRDGCGRPLEIIEIPSPGRIDDDLGLPLPASYLNYYVANGRVVVPVYGSAYDAAAVDAIAACFEDSVTCGALAGARTVVGLPARHILTGGGAFHCITQQEPAADAAPTDGGAGAAR